MVSGMIQCGGNVRVASMGPNMRKMRFVTGEPNV